MAFEPGYLRLYATGELHARAEAAAARLDPCRLCPRGCAAHRREGELGACGIGAEPVVSAAHPHAGEEPVLTGPFGSGTVFFTGCNLACRFCQNAEISQGRLGEAIAPSELAEIMVALQNRGCPNINLVSPTHQVAQILAALPEAVERGLMVPLVYNCGGYESVATLRLLEGVVDIYMPDLKYGDDAVGERLSGVPDYWRRARAAVREMHRQVGDLVLDRRGLAQRGLLVRHLVLPGGLAGSRAVARFLAEEISRDTCVNVMDQYHPAHRAAGDPLLGRRPEPGAWEAAVATFREAGLRRLVEV